MKSVVNSLSLTHFKLVSYDRTKCKQPKQHEINRKLLIKCFRGNDKTSLWSCRFACVAQYLLSKFLESCAGKSSFTRAVTGKAREMWWSSHGQTYFRSVPQGRKSIEARVEEFWTALINHSQRKPTPLCKVVQHARAHEMLNLCTLSWKEIDRPYCIEFRQATNTPVLNDGKHHHWREKDRFQVYALSNLNLIFIRKNNNRWKFTGTLWQNRDAYKDTIIIHVVKFGKTTRQFTTIKLQSSEILEVEDKRNGKWKVKILDTNPYTKDSFLSQ